MKTNKIKTMARAILALEKAQKEIARLRAAFPNEGDWPAILNRIGEIVESDNGEAGLVPFFARLGGNPSLIGRDIK